MAGISNYLETVLVDLVFNATAYAGQSTVYTKLHIGDPGEAGTSNAAAETTRKATTLGAGSAGTVTSDADITWTNLAGTETLSHVSLWDNISAGNCLWKGALTATKAVVAGDTFTIASGSLSISLD